MLLAGMMLMFPFNAPWSRIVTMIFFCSNGLITPRHASRTGAKVVRSHFSPRRRGLWSRPPSGQGDYDFWAGTANTTAYFWDQAEMGLVQKKMSFQGGHKPVGQGRKKAAEQGQVSAGIRTLVRVTELRCQNAPGSV